MSNLSRQKVEYISHDATIKRGGSPYLELVYKRLDGDNAGKESKTGAFVAQLDKESKDLIKAGGRFVITKTKSGDFWNLTKVEGLDTWVDKPTSSYNGGGNSKYSGNKGGSSTYNTAGVKVGAVLHDAVALAGAKAKLSTVKELAEELLILSYELEANVNSGKYVPKATVVKNATVDTPPPKEPVDGLEEVDW